MKKITSKIIQLQPLPPEYRAQFLQTDGTLFTSPSPLYLVLLDDGDIAVYEFSVELATLEPVESSNNFKCLVNLCQGEPTLTPP